MANPTIRGNTVGSPSSQTSATKTVTASWTSGDKIVILAVSEDQANPMATPSATGLGSVTSKGVHNVAGSCWAGAWEGTATSTQSGVTVSSVITGGLNARGFLLVIVVDPATSAGTAYTVPSGDVNPTTSLTRAGTDSTIIGVAGDWSATAARAASPSTNSTSIIGTLVTGAYTAYGIRWDSQGAAGTTSYGVAGAAFGSPFTRLYVEIQGTASSGVNYSNSPADSVGVTDAAGTSTDYARAPADPVGVTDSASVGVDYVRSMSDSVGVTDSASTGYARTPADPVGITDATSVGVDYVRGVSDAVGIADTSGPIQVGIEWTQDDAVGVTDAASTKADYARLPADPVGATDSVATAADYARLPADPVAVTDSASIGVDYVRALADAVGAADTASGVITNGANGAASDPVGVGDSVGTSADYARSPLDPVGVSDAATASAGYARTTADPVGAADTATASLDIGRAAADPVGVTDSASAVLTPSGPGIDYAKSVADGVTVADILAAVAHSAGGKTTTRLGAQRIGASLGPQKTTTALGRQR